MDKSLFRRSINRVLHLLARFLPGCTSVRPFLHKLRGVKIEGDIFIGDDVYLENEYPDHIEIHDQAQITIRATIIAHFRGAGRVIIGSKVWIGPHAVIAASAPGQVLTIGEGSVIGAGSVVVKDIPPFTFVGGVPAKPIARVTVPMTLSTSYEDFQNGLIRISRSEEQSK
jgi:acetyltransferase-like isoleucine patch superfamily enzyme